MLGAPSIALAQVADDAAPTRGLDVDMSIGYMYDDNVTRAPGGPDKLSDQFYTLNLSKSFEFRTGESTRISLEALVGGELTRKYPGLGNIFGGVQSALQYRGSADFSAPTFALFGRAIAEHFGSTLRSGYRYAVGVSVRQPLTDRIGVFGALAHNWRYGKSSVFDTHENAALLSVDYTTPAHGTLTLSGEYRRGNLVSTGQKNLTIIDIAEVFVDDDVFTSPQMIDYRFAAKTALGTLAYNLPIGEASALELSWRYVQSTSVQRASFPDGGKLRYNDNQFTVQWLVRF